MHDENTSRRDSSRPRRLLIAADLSAASKHAVDFARYIAPPHADVLIVSVAENPRTLIPLGSLPASVLDDAREELLRDATDAVDRARERFARDDVRLDAQVIELAKSGGDVIHALIDCATTWEADLMIVGAREHQGYLSRWASGTVSEPLLKLAHCPILIVPAGDGSHVRSAPRRILFAIDGSEFALQALKFGLTFSGPETELRTVYVVDRAAQLLGTVPVDTLDDAFIKQGEQALRAAKPLLDKAGANRSTSALVSTALTHDDVAQAILREAEKWQADLIVLGTHGRRGIARWLLGSVAGRVARASHTPIMLVGSRPS